MYLAVNKLSGSSLYKRSFLFRSKQFAPQASIRITETQVTRKSGFFSLQLCFSVKPSLSSTMTVSSIFQRRLNSYFDGFVIQSWMEHQNCFCKTIQIQIFNFSAVPCSCNVSSQTKKVHSERTVLNYFARETYL